MKSVFISMLLTASAAGLCSCSAGGDREGSADTQTVVYVCTETGEQFALSERPVPAFNPNTDRLTLSRGLYCPKCESWYPAPPLDRLDGNQAEARCPETGDTLLAEGPIPADAIREQ